jgi:hypothetical protein
MFPGIAEKVPWSKKILPEIGIRNHQCKETLKTTLEAIESRFIFEKLFFPRIMHQVDKAVNSSSLVNLTQR